MQRIGRRWWLWGCFACLPALAPSAATADTLSWLNPATAPFIPLPNIDIDPDTGNTIGIMPVFLHQDDQGKIERILAPDFSHNQFFGYGVHLRMVDYPSDDQQWSVVTGLRQRVERALHINFLSGLERDVNWSLTAQLIYDRNGTPRFFGIGNETPRSAETNYTEEQAGVQDTLGYNFNHTWQLAYMVRARYVYVTPGSLIDLVSIEKRFAGQRALGRNDELLNRLQLSYDTRNSLTIPTRGVQAVAYVGLASRRGDLNDTLYNEIGVDTRSYQPLPFDTILVLHGALRYLAHAHSLPFWAYSTIGGDSVIGGTQPLRAFGDGRFTDQDSISMSAELRHRVGGFHTASNYFSVEVTPFVDIGRVFHDSRTSPLTELHHVVGLGLRGLAPPYVVGYIDVGYGSDGAAIYTGVNYPF